LRGRQCIVSNRQHYALARNDRAAHKIVQYRNHSPYCQQVGGQQQVGTYQPVHQYAVIHLRLNFFVQGRQVYPVVGERVYRQVHPLAQLAQQDINI